MTEANWPLGPLPWQQQVWARLQAEVAADGLSHALLFSGEEGIGKSHLCQALAALLLCHQPTAGTACGDCHSCRLLPAGSHSDLLMLEPEQGSRVIKIDQVRALINFANQTASLGSRKVILLYPAEAMNLNSANALLKCLEEPAPGTYLLLASHASGNLPATVRSRCRSLLLPTPARDQTLSWLQHITGELAVSEALLQLLGNKPMTAQSLYLSDGLEQRQSQLQGLDGLIAGSISAIEFPPLMKDLQLAQVLTLLLERLQARIRTQSMGQGADLRQHFLLLDELHELRRAVQNGGNPNRQLTIENSAAQLAQVLGAAR